MLLKVPRCVNIGYNALSLSYSPNERKFVALYHEVRDWNRLLTLLKRKVQLCFYPMFLPAALFSCYRFSLQRYRDVIDSHVYDTEHSLGYAIPGPLERYDAMITAKRWDTSKVDYESIVRRLNSSQTELATMGTVARFSKDCGDSLIHMIHELELYTLFGEDESFHKTREDILHEVEFSRTLTTSLLSQIQSLKERVQSEINLVGHPLGYSSHAERASRLIAVSRFPDLQSDQPRW